MTFENDFSDFSSRGDVHLHLRNMANLHVDQAAEALPGLLARAGSLRRVGTRRATMASGAPATGGGPSQRGEAAPEGIDVWERGAPKDGVPQRMNRRLYMQLLVFRSSAASEAWIAHLQEAAIGCVLYANAQHPHEFGLLTWSEDPQHFVQSVRPLLARGPSADGSSPAAEVCRDMCMMGRTYSTGYEPDLPYFLLDRPVETSTNPAWPWAIWYPLRRKGSFAQLEGRDQGRILREHATLGRAYGEQGLAHDVRLACHGLDTYDNDFVIGLIGETLHPLSHVVQAMRKTEQTAQYIEALGPFFVGYALHQQRGPAAR